MKFQTSALLALIFLTGCASQLSTLSPTNNSQQTIYKLSDQEACQLASTAMTRVFPNNEITEVGGATCGLSTLFRAPPLYADTYTEILKVFPASGVGKEGQKVSGFFFEVSGGGSSFLQGQLKASELHKVVRELADQTGKGALVSNAKPIPVQVVTTAPKNTVSAIEERLKVIDELKAKGLISDADYNIKKKSIMDEI